MSKKVKHGHLSSAILFKEATKISQWNAEKYKTNIFLVLPLTEWQTTNRETYHSQDEKLYFL